MQVLYWKEIKQGGLMRAEKRFLLFVNRRHRYCQGPLAGNRSVVVVTPERNLSYFDKQRIAFRPSFFQPLLSLKNATYRIFIWGLALAGLCGLLYTDKAWSLYDFTRRATPMHFARPQTRNSIYRGFGFLSLRISPLSLSAYIDNQ